jgi:hypothetical protein
MGRRRREVRLKTDFRCVRASRLQPRGLARVRAVVARRVTNAAAAAPIAQRVSSAPKRGTVPRISPVAGLSTLTVCAPAIHAPSM